MLTAEEKMELEVLRKHGAGIRELARVTGWSRNTVRRYLREGDAAAVRKAAPKRAEKLDPKRLHRRSSEGSGAGSDASRRFVPRDQGARL